MNRTWNRQADRRFRLAASLTGVVVLLTTLAVAGIPEPDAILYGTVSVNGLLMAAGDDVTIIAKVEVNSVEQRTGSYHMGDNKLAGDNYVLKMKLETLLLDEDQSPDAGVILQTAKIYVQRGVGPDRLADEFVLSERGVVAQRDLAIITVDFDGDGAVELDDYAVFAACMAGPGVPPNANPSATVQQCLDAFDHELDGDVDLEDLQPLQTLFSG